MSEEPPEEIGYAEAMAELESILDDLEDDDLDVDVLASRVERAATLIQVCRERIGAARVQVERVVASLEPTIDDDVASVATETDEDEAAEDEAAETLDLG